MTPSSDKPPYLLTPGPLTTTEATRRAMLRDWGSRDADFIALTAKLRERLVGLIDGETSHTCVPLQGSGTFAIEAAIGSLVPREGKLFIASNGAYGRRMEKIGKIIGRKVDLWETPEDQTPDPAELERRLTADVAITHVAAVHCETTTGILNPIKSLSDITARSGRGFLIDAISSFGALRIDARDLRFDALVASANKGLEGVPGVSFVIARTGALRTATGNAHSLSLDLVDQWQSLEDNGQWRFTPPTQVLAALDVALDQLEAEGGGAGREARYRTNCRLLVDGLRGLGFQTLLDDSVQAPIIVTVQEPGDPHYDFNEFFGELRSRGYVIYPGKLTNTPSFRIGCIGAIDAGVIQGVIAAIAEVVAVMGIARTGP